MALDPNVRSLGQILIIAKSIIDSGKEEQFILECDGNDALFVVSTEAARRFIADFLHKNNIDPKATSIGAFKYGNPTCK